MPDPDLIQRQREILCTFRQATGRLHRLGFAFPVGFAHNRLYRASLPTGYSPST